MYKTKSSNSISYASGTWHIRRCDGSLQSHGTYPEHVERLKNATIHYEVAPYYKSGPKKGLRPFNNCHHEKDVIVNEAQTFDVANGSTYYGYQNAVQSQFALTQDDLARPSPLSAISELNDMNARAFSEMQPSLETDLSLTNFILELRDIPGLVKNIAKWAVELPKWARRVSRPKAKTIGDVHLSYSFGIAPLIRDLQTMYSSIVEFDTRLDDFLAKVNTVQTRHWSSPINKAVERVDTYTSTHANIFKEYTYEERYVFTMAYKYTTEENFTSLKSKIKAFRDMFGLHLGAAQIWEAIPFSFVLDWFIPIGDFLKQFSSTAVKTNVTVLQYGYSHKISTKVRYYFDATSSGCWESHSLRLCGEGERSTYKRRRCLPNSGTYFTSGSRFGANQLALSASLIAVNRR